jgi:predicted dehydrogenase
MNKLRTAVIGCGLSADMQMTSGFRQLESMFSIVACCGRNPKRAREFADRHAIPQHVTDVDELLKQPDIDVVSICTPASSHYSLVIDALHAGKHVICEKPVTSSLALLDDIAAVEASSGSRLMPIFQLRFGRNAWAVKRVIESGLAGRAFVSSAETAWKRGADYYKNPNRGKFASELGGVLVSQSIHIHDLLMWLLGPASLVSAFKTTRVNPIEVEDCSTVSLQMADGSLASLTATLGSLAPLTRFRLCFENVTFENESRESSVYSPATEPWRYTPRTPEIGKQIEEIIAATPVVKPGFAGQFELFYRAVKNGEPFPVTLADARRALELITAAFASAHTGAAIKLPLNAEHPGYRGWVSEYVDRDG